jgi:hypothetical protein
LNITNGRHWFRNWDIWTRQKKAFAKAIRDVYLRAKTEAGYNATYFLRMLSDHGAIETERHLITSTQPSEGFTQLWERGRLDLTVEASVLRPEFVDLFNEEEREASRRRLSEYGYIGAD